MARRKQSNPKRVPRMFQKTSTYHRRRPAKKTYRGVQNKFKLAKPRMGQVKSISTMAECKRFKGWSIKNNLPTPIQTQYLGVTNSATFIPIDPFYFMKSRRDVDVQGTIEGRDIFSKYLQTKLEIKYPESVFGPQGGTRPLEVIYGVATPMNLTDRTTPSNIGVTAQEVMDHIIEQVARDFDSINDTMDFDVRSRRSYNILGRFKVKPNNNGLIPSPFRSDAAGGQIGSLVGNRDVPPLRRNVNWPMMKKVRFERSVADSAEPFLYPNQAYMPFLLLYNPDHANYSLNTTDAEGTPEIKQIKVRHNSMHWFNDF